MLLRYYPTKGDPAHYTAVIIKEGILQVKSPKGKDRKMFDTADDWLSSLPGSPSKYDLTMEGSMKELDAIFSEPVIPAIVVDQKTLMIQQLREIDEEFNQLHHVERENDMNTNLPWRTKEEFHQHLDARCALVKNMEAIVSAHYPISSYEWFDVMERTNIGRTYLNFC